MDNTFRNDNVEHPVGNETSPLLSPPLPDLSLERTHATSNDTSKSPSRNGPDNGLLLEAQRRSADFHLGEYLNLRGSIWSEYEVQPRPQSHELQLTRLYLASSLE